MQPYWENKVALVTGGSRGLGRALAEAFLRCGAKVVITARGQEALDATAAALDEKGLDVLAVRADVTRDDDVENLMAQTIERFGRLDVLVNNVGLSTRGLLESTPTEKFAELYEVNFLAMVRCTRAALPHLLKSQGHIVNIGSLAAKTASPYLGAYAASKFSVTAFSQQLRLEWEPRGVHTLLVCPGPIARDENEARYAGASAELPAQAHKPGRRGEAPRPVRGTRSGENSVGVPESQGRADRAGAGAAAVRAGADLAAAGRLAGAPNDRDRRRGLMRRQGAVRTECFRKRSERPCSDSRAESSSPRWATTLTLCRAIYRF